MICGKRVRLRAIEKEDLAQFVTWLNDPDVREHISMVAPLSRAREELWFEDMLKLPVEEHPLVIEIRIGEEWAPVGNTGFFHLDNRNRSAEIGIFIGEKSLWNQGFGRDAMRLMQRYGFHDLNLHRIYLNVDQTNARGIKSYEHAGFKHEGRFREAFFSKGRYIDLVTMSILSSEWKDHDV
jgi:RimJ/RimL family protein N-acetyltransferase